jgi:hypothetical protein
MMIHFRDMPHIDEMICGIVSVDLRQAILGKKLMFIVNAGLINRIDK